jgi:glycosyltransferase involved in cell wall biosynthesis
MTLVLIASYAPSFINFRKEFILRIIDKGYNVVLLAPDFSSELKMELNEMGAQTCSIYLKRSSISLFKELRCFFSIYIAVKSIAPDVLLSYTIKPVIYGSIVARLCNIKKACSLITGLGHSFLAESFKGRILNRVVVNLYRFSLKKNYAILFQNNDDCELFSDLKILKENQKTDVVNGSGVNIDFYAPSPLPETPVVLLIARLIKEKGIFEFIEAANRLSIKYPEVKFNIVGDFDDQPTSLRQKDFDRIVKTENISFLGAFSDVRQQISDSSIFVLPSYREGTPRSVLEAMSMGRPIITTDVPGCRETVENDYNGFLVEPYDSVLLEKAMEKLINKSNLRALMGKRSREIAIEKYDVYKVINSMIETLDL